MITPRNGMWAGLTFLAAVTFVACVSNSAQAHPPEHGGRGERSHHGPRGGHGERGASFEMFRAADENEDRSVTLAEVEALQDEMFAWLDRDGDGVIGEADRPPMKIMVGPRHRAMDGAGDEDKARSPHRHLDTDEDGQISREEFGARGATHFERLDADEDGVITPDEFDQALVQHREPRFWWREE